MGPTWPDRTHVIVDWPSGTGEGAARPTRDGSTMEHPFGGQPAGTAWTAAQGSVDDSPPSVDGTRPSVDAGAATGDPPRHKMLWCERAAQPQMLWFSPCRPSPTGVP